MNDSNEFEEFKKKYPTKVFGEIIVRRKHRSTYDPRYGPINIEDEGWIAELEHQCDEWYIGSVSEVEKFIDNLIEAINYMKEV